LVVVPPWLWTETATCPAAWRGVFAVNVVVDVTVTVEASAVPKVTDVTIADEVACVMK
jgi:hypothetical protein